MPFRFTGKVMWNVPTMHQTRAGRNALFAGKNSFYTVVMRRNRFAGHHGEKSGISVRRFQRCASAIRCADHGRTSPVHGHPDVHHLQPPFHTPICGAVRTITHGAIRFKRSSRWAARIDSTSSAIVLRRRAAASSELFMIYTREKRVSNRKKLYAKNALFARGTDSLLRRSPV